MKTEFDGFDLDCNWDEIAKSLDDPPPAPQFVLSHSRVHVHRAKEQIKKSRRGIKKLIHPDNAKFLLDHLPSNADERTHAVLRGDFVLCDVIPTIIEARGRCDHLYVATLGMSVANADTLLSLHARGKLGKVTLVCSIYFAQVDRATTYREVVARLAGVADIITTRAHAKVICLPTQSGDSYVIEGSANLRSSDNTEQICIFNDADLLKWHCEWMDSLKQSHA